MVNRLCAPDRLLDETLETARRIADNAPISVRQAKHAIHYGLQMDLASAMMFEIEAYNRMVPTEDRREGIASFNEKRKPRFRDGDGGPHPRAVRGSFAAGEREATPSPASGEGWVGAWRSYGHRRMGWTAHLAIAEPQRPRN